MAKKKRNSESNNQAKRREGQITAREVEDVEDRSSPRTPVIYEVVCRLGEEEMARPAFSLWWSGVAAGMSISFSLLAQAILYTHLPDAPWRPLVADVGYTVGFVMVIMSRQQLFTENTITAVLPVIADIQYTKSEPKWRACGRWCYSPTSPARCSPRCFRHLRPCFRPSC